MRVIPVKYRGSMISRLRDRTDWTSIQRRAICFAPAMLVTVIRREALKFVIAQAFSAPTTPKLAARDNSGEPRKGRKVFQFNRFFSEWKHTIKHRVRKNCGPGEFTKVFGTNMQSG